MSGKKLTKGKIVEGGTSAAAVGRESSIQGNSNQNMVPPDGLGPGNDEVSQNVKRAMNASVGGGGKKGHKR